MSSSTVQWSQKTCVDSTATDSRCMTYDSSEETLYFASDYSNERVFICKMRSVDGVTTYCGKLDGNAADYPYQMTVFGNYIMFQGSSDSSAFKSSSDSWGNFVLWMNKTLQSDWCGALNVATDSSISWTSSTLPMKTITLSDVQIRTTSYFSSPSTLSTSNPTLSLTSVC